MKRAEFKKLCRSIEAGDDRYLENEQTSHAGKAIACAGSSVEVDIYGKREQWAMEECSEIGEPDFDFHR